MPPSQAQAQARHTLAPSPVFAPLPAANVKPITKPPVISPATLAGWTRNPSGIKATMTLLRDFLVRWPQLYGWPCDLKLFVTDTELGAWLETFFQSNVDANNIGAFDFDIFLDQIQRFVCGEVRSAESVALDEILTGKLRQGFEEPVPKYAERFLQRSRILFRESQDSLCRHYLSGLTPNLKTRCKLDRDNREWKDLHALVQFSFGEELRLAPSAYRGPSFRPDQNPVRPAHGYRPDPCR
jgi:hypothetical protein